MVGEQQLGEQQLGVPDYLEQKLETVEDTARAKVWNGKGYSRR